MDLFAEHIKVLTEEFENDPDGMFLLNYKLKVFKDYPTNVQPTTEQKIYHLVSQLINVKANDCLNEVMKLPADLRTAPISLLRCVNIIKLHLLLVICMDAWADQYRDASLHGWKLKLGDSYIIGGCIPSLYFLNESDKENFTIITILWEEPKFLADKHTSEWLKANSAVVTGRKLSFNNSLYTVCSLLQINEAIDTILQST